MPQDSVQAICRSLWPRSYSQQAIKLVEFTGIRRIPIRLHMTSERLTRTLGYRESLARPTECFGKFAKMNRLVAEWPRADAGRVDIHPSCADNDGF